MINKKRPGVRQWGKAVGLGLISLFLPVQLLSAQAQSQKPGFEKYAETIPGSQVSFELVPIAGGEFMMGSPATEKGANPMKGPGTR
jgi:hypothetical protein